ncbi:MAG: nicotinate-nucleotide--dimethylbenzimidazole phosphoribosyltransferase [Actinomycetota bacterium]|nr:nicotinate-nucleotide--dimethylbenzimidazole phosphoribosyltransferase [Actinomycetota bacterium]
MPVPGSTEAMGAFRAALERLVPVDRVAAERAERRQLSLTKPPGSLGRLEELASRLCAIASEVPPPLPHPAAVAVFAADHGVLSQGVSPWPAEVTAQMVANFAAGGAAVNVLARQMGARVVAVDVGVASALPRAGLPVSDGDLTGGLVGAKVRRGSGDISVEDAMEASELEKALDVGAQVATLLTADGARCLVTGDMGIGSTTPSAALVAAFTGAGAAEVTGRGTGIDDSMLEQKVKVVSAALQRSGLSGPEGAARARAEPLAALAAIGGLEHAALVGFLVGGAAQRVPVLLDGVIAVSACLVAAEVAPLARDYWIAGHMSAEPGAALGLRRLGMEPLVDLGMRLGEGSGACLALPLLEAAARTLSEMATFDSAGVSEIPRS